MVSGHGEILMINNICLDDIIDLQKKLKVRWSLSCDNQKNICFDSIYHSTVAVLHGGTTQLNYYI